MMQRYSAYRDSGVEWLGEVPEEWKVVTVAKVAKIINGYPFDSALFNPLDGMSLVRIRDLNSATSEVRYAGEPIQNAVITNDDVLIGMDGDFNVGRWLGDEPALLNQRMCCIRADTQTMTRFLEYALVIPLKRINDLTYATTVKHLASQQVKKTRIAVPPLGQELEHLVGFLDRETKKIDDLVENQRLLIALLREKRQAVISHAVTKGLNPTVRMRPSGVDWLGDVPKGWDVVKIKDVAKMESGHTPDRSIEAYWSGDEIPWVSLADTKTLKDSEYISETVHYITEAGIRNSSARLLPAGIVVFSRDATIGRCAITTKPMAVSQHFIAWICSDRVNADYLLFCLRSMQGELERLTFGATLKTIGMPDVRRLAIAIPSYDEQMAIVSHVRTACLQIDELIYAAQDAMRLLQERRAALISAAVTGKIDVRELAPARTEAA